MPAHGALPRLHAKWNDERCSLFVMRFPGMHLVRHGGFDLIILDAKYI